MNFQFIQKMVIQWNKIDGGSYLREIEAVRSGKSTVLEALAIACGFNPEGGSRNYSFSTYDSHSELCRAVKVMRGYRRAQWGYFLRAESFYNVATKEEEYADADHPSQRFHEKSHGESLLALA